MCLSKARNLLCSAVMVMPMTPQPDAVETGAGASIRPPSDALPISWMVTAIFALFWLELIWRLQMEWSVNPQYAYGWTVPPLAAFLFWRRWRSAPPPARPGTRWLPIAVMIACAFLIVPVRLVQEANPDWRLMSWSMALATVLLTFAAIYLAGGAPWLRHFRFPLLFFLVAVPWPMQFEQLVIQGLMRADAAINVEVLNAIGTPAVQLGNVIEVATGLIGINEACTGVRSLQATFMVSLFLGEFYGFASLHRLLLVATGAGLAFFCNLVRTFLLVWLGAEHGVEAIARWHDPAGYSILLVCLFGLWALSLFLPRTETPVEMHRPAAPFRLPRVALAALLLVLVSAEAGTQFWYRMHETGPRIPAWTVSWPTTARNYQVVPVAEEAQELLRYNEGGGGSWTSETGHRWAMYFFRWWPGRTAALFIKNHRPDICLPASGMIQRGPVQHKIFTINDIAIPIRLYEFESNGALLHVYYCYWDGTPPKPGTSDQENWDASGRLRAVLQGKREIGTQMLELLVFGYDEPGAAERAVREQLHKIIRPTT